MKPFVIAAALAALSTLASLALAASPAEFALRGGWAFEAAQHTLDDGPALGASFEWPTRLGATGIAIDWAHDGGGSVVKSVDVLVVGAFARWQPESVRLYLEAGLGYGQVHRDVHLGPLDESFDDGGAAGWAGTGVRLPVRAPFGVRLDARYHLVLTETPGALGESGNAEDLWTAGVTFVFGAKP